MELERGKSHINGENLSTILLLESSLFCGKQLLNQLNILRLYQGSNSLPCLNYGDLLNCRQFAPMFA